MTIGTRNSTEYIRVHCAAMTQMNHLRRFGKIIYINPENDLKHISLDEVQGQYTALLRGNRK
jgi:uncharacterized protein YlbG (UPF0298 family)